MQYIFYMLSLKISKIIMIFICFIIEACVFVKSFLTSIDDDVYTLNFCPPPLRHACFERPYLERPIRLPRQPKVLHIAQAQVEFHVCERAGTEKINKVYLLKIVFRIYKTCPINMNHQKNLS